MWLELLYPDRCLSCDAWTAAPGFCPRCALSLYPTAPCCPVCALPEESLAAVTCRRCRMSPPPYARVIAPWRYGGELAVAIRRLKYGGARGSGRPDLARPLGALLAPFLTADIDLIVPVPLHPVRLRDRGFSQAHAVAGAARRAARLPVPVRVDLLLRRRATDEQAGLTRAARARNVAGAFVLGRGAAALEGRRVLLVDDVMTTGATASACARVLRKGGAAEIIVAALARAEG